LLVPSIFFEDFIPDSSAPYGSMTVSREELVGFAREFDPQPMHTDAEAAKHTFVGQLIASGWGTAALNMRMMCDDFVLKSASMGGPGVDELKWLKPVLPGDTLTGQRTVLAAKASSSKPDRGIVKLKTELTNQRGERVLEQVNVVMIGRRGTEPVMSPAASRADRPLVNPPPLTAARPTPFLDDLVPGEPDVLGSFTFREPDILRFGRAYDPQPFHTDPEAARASFFGGLIASGWHTAGGWMRTMIDFRRRCEAMARDNGLPCAALGPSPGFRDLRWLLPVYAGDTITYSTAITAARPSASRPGWGLATQHNTGVNQYGDTVFEFTGAVLWQRRPGGVTL
jgi:acyl dehydratase